MPILRKPKPNEANFPTQCCSPQAYPWISRSHGYTRRPPCFESTPSKGANPFNTLKFITSDTHFPRRARINRQGTFADVFAQPVKSSDRYFTVLARPNDLSRPRLGMAISMKVAKLSVVRNRLKRIVRESFRYHQQELGSLDCVVLGRYGLIEEDNAVLFASLEQHWLRFTHLCASY